MSLLKKLAGETAIYGLSHILSRVLLFIVFTFYLTRRFDGDTTEYGIYTDMYSYAAVILTILVFRMDTAFFRYGSKGDLQKVFNTGFLGVLGFCAIVLLILLPNIDSLAKILKYNESPHYIKWFAYILVLDAITALVFARLRLQSRPIRFMVYKLINVGLTLVLVLAFLEFLPSYFPAEFDRLNTFLGVHRQIDYVFFANLLASGAVVIAMLPEFKSFRPSFDYDLFKKMLWYALPLVAVALAGNINQAFAAPLQKYFLGNDIMDNLANAGVYGAAAKLAILLNLFTTAFNYAAEPFFFNNADRKDSLQIYGKVALAFTIVACLAAVGLIFYIDVIILLLGETYRSGVNIVPILLFAYVFLGLYYNVSIWYKLKDKTYIGALISFMGAFITICISLLLLPKIGTIASAWAALACYVSMVVVGYFVGQRYYPVNYPVRRILSYVGVTVALSIFVLYLRPVLGVSISYFGIVTLLLGILVIVIYKLEWKKLFAE
ncbi:MAG: polysaccharide biosynthesis C-terminal domain-containing protein [Saprospiraceae bacterium]|nr:polysaccharide biosynthesis C-terminal domain-containing protein [Saprospiraceae bacterium]